MPPVDYQTSPYPRRGPLLGIRAFLLWGWAIVVPYLLNVIANLYVLSQSQPAKSSSIIEILLTLARPVFFSGPGKSINAWVIATFLLPLPLILASFLWAKYDLSREEDAKRKRELGEFSGIIVTTIHDELGLAIKVAAEKIKAVPGRSIRIRGSDPPRSPELIGRDRELSQVIAWLKASQTVAVLSVQGLPSVGKTALAAEAVARLAEDVDAFPGGAAWISCSDLQGPEGLALLWSRIAHALDTEDARAALADHSLPHILIALDNVEPGLDLRAILDTIAGGRATLLLTSRHAPVPNRVQRLKLKPLQDQDARALFITRLNQIDEDRPRPDELRALDALLPSLDGLPLAIELVASYAGLQVRSLDEVVEEIRHEGIRAGALKELSNHFDRSWRVLSSSQRRFFAGLAELAEPSFPREAALAVAQAARRPGGSRVAEDLEGTTADLSLLIGMNLLEPLAGHRLRLHPLLREFAESKLEELPLDVTSQLGASVLTYWQQFVHQHHGVKDADALEAEASALMGVVQWAYIHDQRADVLELVRILSDIWEERERYEELKLLLDWAIKAASGLRDEGADCEMTLKLARVQTKMGQSQFADMSYEAAATKAKRLRDPATQVAALIGLAAGERRQVKYTAARDHLGQALELTTTQTESVADERAIHHELALVSFEEGEHISDALSELYAALTCAQAIPDPKAIDLEQQWIARLTSEHPELGPQIAL